MAKPTTTFGAWSFGKDGSVKPQFETLPADKVSQEAAAAKKLLALAGGTYFPAQKTSVEMLPENDNDLRILADGKPVAVVECIELVARDYLAPKGVVTAFGIAKADGTIDYADTEKIANALTDKIRLKLAKKYAKPADMEFWLLIWSVTGLPEFGHWWEGGERKFSESTLRARKFCSENTPDPFDRVLFFDLQTHPTTVYPA
jgi:hypothetical protein